MNENPLRKRIREHAPKSHEAFGAALGFPLLWFLVCAGAVNASDKPSPPGTKGWPPEVVIVSGIVLWLWAAWLLHKASGEPDGRTPRFLAFALLACFAPAIGLAFAML